MGFENSNAGIHLLGYLNESQLRDAAIQKKENDFMHLIGYLSEEQFRDAALRLKNDIEDLRMIAKDFDIHYSTDMSKVVENCCDF